MTDELGSSVYRVLNRILPGVGGSAFVIDGRHLLTCGHNLAASVEELPDGVESVAVSGDSQLHPLETDVVWKGEESDGYASVLEDIAVLETRGAEIDPPVELADEVNVGHPFVTFGYPPEWGRQGNSAAGTIGRANASGAYELYGAPGMGFGIRGGFSGAPVFDRIAGAVTGMVTGSAGDAMPDRWIGFMIPIGAILDRVPADLFEPQFRRIDEAYFGYLSRTCVSDLERASAESYLIRSLEKFRDDAVSRQWLYYCLGLVGSRSARTVLTHAVRNDDGIARHGAEEALGMM